jgi:hypothetical protein
MSADRKISGYNYTTPKIQIIGDSIVGVAGLVTATNKFFTWFRAGCPADGAPELVELDKENDSPFSALVLNRRGLFIYNEACEPDKVVEANMAIGTGGDVAVYCMRIRGMSPAAAVREAARLEAALTGPKVDSIPLSAVPKVKG